MGMQDKALQQAMEFICHDASRRVHARDALFLTLARPLWTHTPLLLLRALSYAPAILLAAAKPARPHVVSPCSDECGNDPLSVTTHARTRV